MLQKIRNIRKRWLLIPAAAALLAVGIVGGAALAAGSPAFAPNPGYGYGIPGDSDHRRGGHSGHHEMEARLLARVAEIVGVETAALEKAFDTAHHELANAEFAAKMNALAADGTLTDDQAAAAVSWFNDRPDDTGQLASIAAMTANSDKVTRLLNRGVAKGYLTQEQADAIAAWHQQRPDFIPQHDRDRGRHHGKGNHDRDDDNNDASDSDSDGDAG